MLEGRAVPTAGSLKAVQFSLREHSHSWDSCTPRHSSAMLRADTLCSALLMLKGGARASRAGRASASRAAQAAEPGQDLPQIPVATAILSTGTSLCCSGPELHGLSHTDHRVMLELQMFLHFSELAQFKDKPWLQTPLLPGLQRAPNPSTALPPLGYKHEHVVPVGPCGPFIWFTPSSEPQK